MPKLSEHDYMMAWASMMHAGSYLIIGLSKHFEKEIGLTLTEQDLLSQLDKAGGDIRMVDLANRVFVSKAGITKMMDRLVKAGLVKREPSKQDRRSISARLTPAGKRLLKKSRVLLKAWVEENFRDHLSPDEILALKPILQNLLKGQGRLDTMMTRLKPQKTKS